MFTTVISTAYTPSYIYAVVLGLIWLVGLWLPLLLRLGLIGLASWLVSGIALNKYHCEYGTINSVFA